MPKKQPKVPGTREITPNREQRRHPEQLDPARAKNGDPKKS
jgi:hypothetical protein